MHLAQEIYQLIFQHVDSKADLHRLLFVSRTVSSEAERALYHTIRVINRANCIPSRVSMALYFHLVSCPRVADYVRELEILGGTLQSSSFSPFRFRARPQNYFHVINRVLQALTHLRVLTLSTWVALPSSATIMYPPASIFLNCAFTLDVFKYREYEANEFPHIDLTQVKELYLQHRQHQVLRCHPDTFHSLKILSASLPQFRSLGGANTGRIRALDLQYQVSPTDIEGTFPNVVSLKIHVETQNTLIPFPSLRFLQLIAKLTDILADAKRSQILDKLASSRNLEGLCIVTYGKVTAYPLDLPLKIFAAISSLKELILSDENGGPSLFWENDGGRPVHIQYASIKDEWKNPRWLQD